MRQQNGQQFRQRGALGKVHCLGFTDKVNLPFVFREYARNRDFMRRLALLWTMFFTAGISTYANDLNSSSLSGNLFLNQFLFGLLIACSESVRAPAAAAYSLKL